MSPLQLLRRWIEEERQNGVAFANGAVLGTVSASGESRTRMLGVHFDEQGFPRFHTTPGSRKVLDLRDNAHASLTFAFQRSLRSVSLEGEVAELTSTDLSRDWLSLEAAFRRSYLVFGPISGQALRSPPTLNEARRALSESAEQLMPTSFIGFRFQTVRRIAFYSVGEDDFAQHTTHHFNTETLSWSTQSVVP
ncbi:MAG: pyridoxamine 5'-phosphate oxidase family protein [Rugosibacter sp.]|nr:pyridoxamine 5'-phosphate oxidase family protein [Rugosibacter sp.]